jgi:ribosomal protein S6E (S10)
VSKMATIWIGVDVRNISKYEDILVKCGFSNPYICKKSVLGYTFQGFGVGMYKKNIGNDKIDVLSNKNEITYVMNQFRSNKNKCGISSRFTTRTINKFKKLPYIGFTKNKDGSKSQKEIGGNLVVNNIVKIEGKIVYIMDIDNNSIDLGENEEVSLNGTRYNFHSHPKEAYDRHGVTKGWPSSHDYIGFTDLVETIYHCVVTIEGVYVISFNKEWKGKIDKKFIEKRYSINQSDPMSPTEYAKKINGIIYKKKSPIFSVKYISWENCSDIFTIYYSHDGVSCIPTEKSYIEYEKFYK